MGEVGQLAGIGHQTRRGHAVAGSTEIPDLGHGRIRFGEEIFGENLGMALNTNCYVPK
jgi:hypothetical protein